MFQIVQQRFSTNDSRRSFYDKKALHCSTCAQQSAVILFASNQAVGLSTNPVPYIFSGAVTPISPSARARTILAASHSRSRARLIARSAGSPETTRQSR